MRKLPFGRTLVALIAGWLAAGWFWSAPAVPRAVLTIQSNQLLFSPDSRWLVTDGSWALDDALMVWNVASSELHRKLRPPPGSNDGASFGRSVAFSADSKQLAVAGTLRPVFVWSMEQENEPNVIACGDDFPFPQNDLFFVGHRLFRFNFRIGQTWDLQEKRVVQTFKEAPRIRSMGTGIGYAYSDELRLFDLKTGETLSACPLPKHHSFAGCGATADGLTLFGHLAGGWGPHEPILWDVAKHTYRKLPTRQSMTALAISADGHWCAMAAIGTYHVNVAAPSETLLTAEVAKNNAVVGWIANCLDSILPDRFGHLTATKQNLFVMRTGDFVVTDALPDVIQAKISPDGKTLATISENGGVSLWDFPIPRPVGKTVAASISVGFAVFLLLTLLKRSTTGPATAKSAGQ